MQSNWRRFDCRKSKSIQKSLNDNNCKFDAKAALKAFQDDLIQKIKNGEIKKEKALKMAANKKIELGITN